MNPTSWALLIQETLSHLNGLKAAIAQARTEEQHWLASHPKIETIASAIDTAIFHTNAANTIATNAPPPAAPETPPKAA
jgi:hypothetical protein